MSARYWTLMATARRYLIVAYYNPVEARMWKWAARDLLRTARTFEPMPLP